MKSFQGSLLLRKRIPAIFGAACAIVLGAVVISSSLSSCAALNAITNLSRIQFKLNDVQQVRLGGVDITNKHSISDFSVMDGINLMGTFSSGRLPLTFTLNVAAKNPNPASNNAALSSLKVTDFPWRLLLNGNETISGNIGAPVGVPPGGATTIIPLQVTVDLKQFFANKGYNDLVNLALTIAGKGGVSQIQLKATPTMSTPLGSVRYPGELTIVSTQFSS
jgi:hypothetical protein